MQEINHALRQRDLQRLAACLNQTHHVGFQMQGVLRSLKHNYKYVINGARSPYSNGALEGTIRKIKQFQRVAYGFRNYDQLIRRIMLLENTKVPKNVA